MLGVPMPQPLKFPDRFFAVHKQKMKELAGRYGPGAVVAFVLHEDYAHFFGDDQKYIVHIKTVESEKGTHIVPMTALDVKTAEDWEARYRKVPDDELVCN